jgi:hypothetical protein
VPIHRRDIALILSACFAGMTRLRKWLTDQITYSLPITDPIEFRFTLQAIIEHHSKSRLREPAGGFKNSVLKQTLYNRSMLRCHD